MNTLDTSSVTRPPTRRRIFAATVAALLGAAVLTAPGEARAGLTIGSLGEWVLSGAVGQLAGDGVTALLFGSSTSTSLTAADYTAISTLITDALAAQSVTTVTSEAQAVISAVQTYSRGTTSTDLTTAMTTTNGIISNAQTVMSAITSQSAKVQYSLASTYSAMAMIRVSFFKERRDIASAQGTQASGSSINYATDTIGAAENALKQLKIYNGYFNAQFTGSFVLSMDNVTGWAVASSSQDMSNNYSLWKANYCTTYTPYGGSAQSVCPWTTVSKVSSDPAGSGYFVPTYYTYTPSKLYVDATTAAKSKANAQVWFQNFKAYQRDQQLGTFFFETMATLEKAATGVTAFCGDGICSPSEAHFQFSSTTSTYTTTPQCTTDCLYAGTSGSSSSSTQQAFAVLDFGTDYPTYTNSPVLAASGASYSLPASNLTLLKADGAHLDWQTDGNLVLYSSSGVALWDTNTGGTGRYLSLQNDGNVCVYGSSNNYLWGTQTTPSSWSSDGSTERPVHLVLTNQTLYVVDTTFYPWWSSATDTHLYGTLSSASTTSSPRQCWTKSTSNQVIATNSLHDLVFGSDGGLRVYLISSGATVWDAGVAGNGGTGTRAQYLCNQEDGNLVMYDASYNALWYTSTGSGSVLYNFNGWGGDLALLGSQIQLLAPSGEPTWASTVCSGTDSFVCATGASVVNYAVPTSASKVWGTSASTILSNNYAKLLWTQSTGNLSVWDETAVDVGTGTTATNIWSKTFGTTGGSLYLDTTGSFYITDGGATLSMWQGGSAAGGHLQLAGCNLSVLDAGDHAVWTARMACSYGNYNNPATWLAN